MAVRVMLGPSGGSITPDDIFFVFAADKDHEVVIFNLQSMDYIVVETFRVKQCSKKIGEYER